MPFQRGCSGNVSGRPRQTEEQKRQRDEFKSLLCTSTVTALKCIIQIANDSRHKDRFNASKYLIDKAYGTNTAFLLDGKDKDASVAYGGANFKFKNTSGKKIKISATTDGHDVTVTLYTIE